MARKPAQKLDHRPRDGERENAGVATTYNVRTGESQQIPYEDRKGSAIGGWDLLSVVSPLQVGKGVAKATETAAIGVGNAAKAVAGAIGGLMPSISADLKNFPKYTINPAANTNFQSLYNQAPYQPMQVQGFGNVTPLVPQVRAQQVSAQALNPGLMSQSRNLGLQARMQQEAALGQLQAAAAGAVPSAAEIQSRAALQQATQQQLALANSARGGAAQRYAAQRSAQAGIGALQQGAISQTAALRAQEQAAARDALVGALSGVRSQDAALQGLDYQHSLSNAQLAQQAVLANQATALQAGLGNQQAVLNALLSDQANQFRVESANQQAGLQGAGLDIQRLLGAAQGVLGVEQLGFQAFNAPQALAVQLASEEAKAKAALYGGLAEAGSGFLTKAFGF